MNDTPIPRSRFLLAGLAAIAGSVAAKIDPEGEPLPEGAAAVVVNAPGVTLQNFSIKSGAIPRRAALQINSTHDTLIRDGRIEMGPPFKT